MTLGVRNRVAAPILIGGSLVMLVAIATAAVAWLLWTRADDRSREQDDRAAQTVNEALQNSVGRVLTSLRAAAGLVNANGEVDRASFQSYARALGSIGASDGLALAEIVPAAERASFESATGRRISELARPGTLRAAGRREAVRPDRLRLAGGRLEDRVARVRPLEQPRAPGGDRSRAGDAAHDVHRRHPVRAGGPRFPGVPADLPARRERGRAGRVRDHVVQQERDRRRPLTAAAGRARQGERRGRRGVRVGGRSDGGATRTLPLGGRQWLVTARGEPVSRSSSLAILVGGAILALMLGAFTWARLSSERRLVLAHEAERAARERSELLERTAAHLVVAATASEVALSTVADLVAAGVDVAAVYVGRAATEERLAGEGVPGDLYCADRIAAEAMETGRTIEIGASDEIRARYWPEQAPPTPLESLLAVPVLGSRGEVAGALVAGSRRPGWLVPEMRPVVVGVAEQCGVALGACAPPLGRRRGAASCRHPAAPRCEPLRRGPSHRGRGGEHPVPLRGVRHRPRDRRRRGGRRRAHAEGSGRAAIPTLWQWRPVPRSTSTPTADAMRERRPIELHGHERIREAYPPELEQLLADVASMVVVPFPRATGAVGVAFHEDRLLTLDERRMLDAIAEELTRALERAALLEGERDARHQAELMERHASRLAAATTGAEVAAATVGEIEAFGADVVFVWALGDASRLEALASSAVPDETYDRFGVYPLELGGIVSDAMTPRTLVAVDSGEEYDARYPAFAEERRKLGAESLAALPLGTARGDVVGAIFAASMRRRWISADRRPLLLGLAEQTGVALERAQLQAEAERVAEDNSFLALLGESLEQATTVEGRARRIVDEMVSDRATFVAVHLADEDGVVAEIASGGSRPPELEDDERWTEWVQHVVSSGRESSTHAPAPADEGDQPAVATRAPAPRARAQPRGADPPHRGRRGLEAVDDDVHRP